MRQVLQEAGQLRDEVIQVSRRRLGASRQAGGVEHRPGAQYAEDAPQGTMHGFLNMLMMTGFARESFRTSLLEELMEEEFEEVFRFSELGVQWRDQHARFRQ